MNNLISGTPFFVDSITKRETSFSSDFKQVRVSKNNDITGDGSGYNTLKTSLGGMGEFLERYTQSKLSHKINQQQIDAYNINQDKIIKLPLIDVFLADPRLLGASEEYWSDSSGTAFHVNSLDLINSSFLEFIERQSLVCNWLTQTPGIEINLKSHLYSEEIFEVYQNLKPYFNRIYCFDISISQYVSVIITIGLGEHYKSVGLAAEWYSDQALFKSLKECWQLISHYNPAHIPASSPTKILEESTKKTESHLYHDYFTSLSNDELYEKYKYLFGNEKNKTEKENFNPSLENILDLLKNVGEELSIEIIICYLPSIIENIPGSVIKIIGNGAFPNIKTDEINPDLYTINNINTIGYLPNLGKMVPFG